MSEELLPNVLTPVEAEDLADALDMRCWDGYRILNAIRTLDSRESYRKRQTRHRQMRLRHGKESAASAPARGRQPIVRLPKSRVGRKKANEALGRDSRSHCSRVQNMEQPARPVQQSEKRILFELWRARNQGLRAMGFLRELPVGYGPETISEAFHRPSRQRWRLLQVKLHVGYTVHTGSQQEEQYYCGIQRRKHAVVRVGRETRGQIWDASDAVRCGMAYGQDAVRAGEPQ